MEDNKLSIGLLWVEALLCAFFIGIIKTSWGWFFGALVCSAIVLLLPVIGGAIGLFISLFLSVGIGSLFSNPLAVWYVGIVLFIILAFLNSTISLSSHIFFGFSIVIFESFVIAGSIHDQWGNLTISIGIFLLLIALAFVPLVRLFEYVILSLLTLVEVYAASSQDIGKPHTFILAFLIFAFLAYYFYIVYIAIDYENGIKSGKKIRILKKVNKIFPRLETTGTEYERILNRCLSEAERFEFLRDWNNYKLSIWEWLKGEDKKAEQTVPFRFEEWFKVNNRWRDTSYFHSYYEKQINEERYIQKETERIRKLWVCEYCGRINSKNSYQCGSCGAMQKLVIPGRENESI